MDCGHLCKMCEELAIIILSFFFKNQYCTSHRQMQYNDCSPWNIHSPAEDTKGCNKSCEEHPKLTVLLPGQEVQLENVRTNPFLLRAEWQLWICSEKVEVSHYYLGKLMPWSRKEADSCTSGPERTRPVFF